MAKYTIELGKFKDFVFDFDYPYYDEMVKCYFEEKFIEHYYFNEIGFETIGRFKQQLRSYLLRVMPYYKQRYEIELRCKDIDFMLNKDLKETFIREIEGSEQNTSNGSSENNSTSNDVSTNSNISKDSTIQDGISKVTLEQGYLTGASSSDDTSSNNNKTNSSSSNKNNSNRDNREFEKTELLSQGNIGVTSSAELKNKWVECLSNLDDDIIQGARNLFMMVY